MTAEEDIGDTARKARLRRLERVFVPAPIYFVTASAANRRSILAVPEIHRAFLEFARLGEAKGAFIGAYVLSRITFTFLSLWIWRRSSPRG